MHTNAERELTDASLRGCSLELYHPSPRRGGGGVRYPASACLTLPAELGLAAHKAGIPSLCNDKLGIRFVKANWMRLLTYTVLAMQYSKCTDSRACARARTRFIDPDIARVHRASSFPPGIPARDSSYRPFYREREREREREGGKEKEGRRNDELLDPDRALLAPDENAMPECRCQIEFLPYAASRDKYDRKIFAIFEISVCTLGWDVFAVARCNDPRIISRTPFSHTCLAAKCNLSNIYDKYRERNCVSEHSRCLPARSSGAFQFQRRTSRRPEIKKHIIFFFFSFPSCNYAVIYHETTKRLFPPSACTRSIPLRDNLHLNNNVWNFPERHSAITSIIFQLFNRDQKGQ